MILANYRQVHRCHSRCGRALVTLRQNEERNAALKDEMAADSSQRSTRSLPRRVGQYMLVVNALQNLQRSQRDILSVKRSLISARISLCVRSEATSTLVAPFQYGVISNVEKADRNWTPLNRTHGCGAAPRYFQEGREPKRKFNKIPPNQCASQRLKRRVFPIRCPRHDPTGATGDASAGGRWTGEQPESSNGAWTNCTSWRNPTANQ